MADYIDVSEETPRVAYVATAGQTVFSVPFVFFDDEDLDVYVNGTLKTILTHYTASGAESEDGGTITLVTAASAGDSVIIERDIALALSTHVPVSGDLDVPAINLQFSRLVAMLQQVAADFPRSLQQPTSDVDDFDALPAAANRASKYLFFDANGQPSLVASVTTSAAVSAYMLTVITAASEDAAQAALGITDQSAYTGLSNWHNCRF